MRLRSLSNIFDNTHLKILFDPYIISEASWPSTISDRIIDNDEFIKWLYDNGISSDDIISLKRNKNMKEGGVGRAFVLTNHVVKLTISRDEAIAAQHLINQEHPNLAKVIDVRKVHSYVDSFNKINTIYAILQEKLETGVSKEHRIAGGAIYSYLDNNPGFIDDDQDKILQRVIEYLPKKHQSNNRIIMVLKNLLNSIIRLQNDTGFLTQDSHGANLAFKNKEPAFFDLGRSKIDFNRNRTNTDSETYKANERKVSGRIKDL